MRQFDKFNPSTEFEFFSLADKLTNSFRYMIRMLTNSFRYMIRMKTTERAAKHKRPAIIRAA